MIYHFDTTALLGLGRWRDFPSAQEASHDFLRGRKNYGRLEVFYIWHDRTICGLVDSDIF